VVRQHQHARIAAGDNPLWEGRLASNLASQVMSPGKHPPESAQNGPLTPAIGSAAAPHAAHALHETPHDREEQIQAQEPPNHPPYHVTYSLSGGFPMTEYGPDRNPLGVLSAGQPRSGLGAVDRYRDLDDGPI
jgi:hypothetical protein